MTQDWKDADDSFLLCEQSAPSYPAWHSQCPITHSPFPERDNDDEDCYDDDDDDDDGDDALADQDQDREMYADFRRLGPFRQESDSRARLAKYMIV